MKCHHCQAELSDSAVFCGICGTPVKHNRFCDKCGAELDAAASFCGQCGKHVEYVMQKASNSLEDTPLDSRSIQLQAKISFWNTIHVVTFAVYIPVMILAIICGAINRDQNVDRRTHVRNIMKVCVGSFILGGIINRVFVRITSKYEKELQNTNYIGINEKDCHSEKMT